MEVHKKVLKIAIWLFIILGLVSFTAYIIAGGFVYKICAVASFACCAAVSIYVINKDLE